MKKLLTATILITAMFCFNSCRNAHSVNGAEITETIDTSDCGRLVQYIDLGRAGTQFSIRKEFSIHSKLKLPIKLDVYRNVLFDNKYVNIFVLKFQLDSNQCIDSSNHITFNFTDNTFYTLHTSTLTNCLGIFNVAFDTKDNKISESEIAADLKKLTVTKVKSFSIETHKGTVEYELSDVEAINLMHLLNCVYSAK